MISLRGGRQNLSARAVRIAQAPWGLPLRPFAPLRRLGEVRALALGATNRLLVPPGGYPRVIPREEDLRHPYASELRRAGELGVLQEVPRERLLRERRGINRPRDEAQDRVTEDDRGWLTPREDEVAKAELEINVGANAVIHPLVAPADDDQM